MDTPARIIRVTSKRAGFRRAGIAHPATPTDHDAASLSEDQIAALKAEAMLIVEDIGVAQEGSNGDDKGIVDHDAAPAKKPARKSAK